MKIFKRIPRRSNPEIVNLCILLLLAAGVAGCSQGGPEIVVIGENGVERIGPLNAGLTSASGDFRAILTIQYPDGTPAAGLPYVVKCPLTSSSVIVGSGEISPEGSVLIEGLAGGSPPVIYHVEVDGDPAGYFLIGTDTEVRSELILPAKTGMLAPSLALRDLASGEKFDVRDLRGRLVFLEFYTTDCAPCQPMLQKLNEVLGRRTVEWEGEVNVFAVGLDAVLQRDTPADRISTHLRRRGWKHLRPIVPDQEFSWERSRQLPFGVRGTPHAFLIGRDGRIIWSGHPGSVDLEDLIEGLLRADPSAPPNGGPEAAVDNSKLTRSAADRTL